MMVHNWLLGPAPRAARFGAPMTNADPYGVDLQHALYLCYELHYRGFAAQRAGQVNPSEGG